MSKVNNKKDKQEKKSIPKTDQQIILLDVPPLGKRHKVTEIGLTVFSKKAALNMSLQWGNGATWEDVRVIQTDSTYRLPIHSEVKTGDDLNRYRFLIENESSEDLDYFYWVDSVLVR